MKPLDLKEFAESLILSGQAEYGREILDLIDLEDQAGIFDETKKELNRIAGTDYPANELWRAVEFLSDRNAALTEIEKKLTEAGYKKTEKLDASDLVTDLLAEMETLKASIGETDFDL